MTADTIQSDSALTAQDAAYIALRRALTSGAFTPGERLTVNQIVAEIGFSTTPVRYALRKLSAAGGLDIAAGRSAQVPSLDKEALAQLLDLIEELELECLQRIKLRAWHIDTANLELSRKRYKKAVEKREYKLARYEAAGFWRNFYALAGSSALSSLLDDIWLRLGPVLAMSELLGEHQLQGIISERLKGFDSLIAGLKSRDENLITSVLTRMVHLHRKWYVETTSGQS
jgi:DNA-binding GntR family transcriptional regulator